MTKVQQTNIDHFLQEFGPENFETAMHMTKILKQTLSRKNFTGQIVFTVNCRNSGIGNVQAFVQNKIK